MTASAVTNYPGIADPFPAVRMNDHNSDLSDPPIFVDDPTSSTSRDLSPRTKAVAGEAIGTAGLELSAGRDLATRVPQQTWFVAKMTLNSAGLEDQINNASYPTAGPSWKSQAVSYAQTWQTTWSTTDLIIVFVQGEHDAGDFPDQDDYLAQLQSYFGTWRASFPNCGIVIVKLCANDNLGGGLAKIRAAQVAFRDATSRCALVDIDDFVPIDNVHFSSNDYVTMGLRCGDAIRSLIPNLNTTPFDIVTSPISTVSNATPIGRVVVLSLIH